MHEKEGLFVPELIFGHLLTGSNFDDNLRKVTGGRNGLGAKLVREIHPDNMILMGNNQSL